MTAMTKTEFVRTAVIIIAAFFAYGVVAGLRATSSVFTADISALTGISYGTVSDIATIRNLLFAISCPIWGFLTLRKPHSFVMILGLILVAVGFAGLVLLPNMAGLIIFQGICFGIGAAAVCYSIVYAAAAPFLSPGLVAVFAGLLSMAQGVFNIILAPIVNASTGVPGGFLVCMVLIGAFLAALIPVMLFFRWHNTNTQAVSSVSDAGYSSVKDTLKTMVKSPFFYLLAASFLIYGLCDGEMVNHLTQRATECMGFSLETATFLVMLYGVALIIGPFLGGLILSRLRNRRAGIAAIFLFWAVAGVIFHFAVHANEAVAPVFTLLIGLSISMSVPFHAMLLQEHVPLKCFAQVFSIISAFPIIGYAVNAFFGGLCFDKTGSFIAFDSIIIGLACLIGIVYLVLGLRKRGQTA